MTRPLLLAYYLAAYGPAVRIDAQSIEDMAAVVQLFKRLASGDVLEEDFGKALGCQLDSIHSLIVRRVNKRPSKALELQYYISEQPSFCWSNIGEDWLEVTDKVDVFLADDSPGHQYLTSEGVDDALVEVCYRE